MAAVTFDPAELLDELEALWEEPRSGRLWDLEKFFARLEDFARYAHQAASYARNGHAVNMERMLQRARDAKL
jgi:hypothetical protein